MNREDFKKNAEKNIDNIFDSIEKMEKQKNNLTASAKVEYDIQLKELKNQQQKMKLALTDLQNASEDKWEDAKTSYNKQADEYKVEYLKYTRTKKEEIHKNIENLKAKASDVHSDSKEMYDEQMEKLNKQKENLSTKYNKLKEASDDKWHEASDAFISASESFGEGFSKIGSVFHKNK